MSAFSSVWNALKQILSLEEWLFMPCSLSKLLVCQHPLNFFSGNCSIALNQESNMNKSYSLKQLKHEDCSTKTTKLRTYAILNFSVLRTRDATALGVLGSCWKIMAFLSFQTMCIYIR